MTNYQNGVLALLICITSFSASAQPPLKEPNYNKPKLFADLPEQLPVPLTALVPLLDLQHGSKVNVQLAPGFHFQGAVVSKSDGSDPSVKSVVLRSSSRMGATFTFTRTQETDGSFAYIGRILSFDHSDAFELQETKGQVKLVKKHQFDLFSE